MLRALRREKAIPQRCGIGEKRKKMELLVGLAVAAIFVWQYTTKGE